MCPRRFRADSTPASPRPPRAGPSAPPGPPEETAARPRRRCRGDAGPEAAGGGAIRRSGTAITVSAPPFPNALTARTSKTYSRPLTRFLHRHTARVPAPTFSHSAPGLSHRPAYRYLVADDRLSLRLSDGRLQLSLTDPLPELAPRSMDEIGSGDPGGDTRTSSGSSGSSLGLLPADDLTAPAGNRQRQGVAVGHPVGPGRHRGGEDPVVGGLESPDPRVAKDRVVCAIPAGRFLTAFQYRCLLKPVTGSEKLNRTVNSPDTGGSVPLAITTVSGVTVIPSPAGRPAAGPLVVSRSYLHLIEPSPPPGRKASKLRPGPWWSASVKRSTGLIPGYCTS